MIDEMIQLWKRTPMYLAAKKEADDAYLKGRQQAVAARSEAQASLLRDRPALVKAVEKAEVACRPLQAKLNEGLEELARAQITLRNFQFTANARIQNAESELIRTAFPEIEEWHSRMAALFDRDRHSVRVSSQRLDDGRVMSNRKAVHAWCDWFRQAREFADRLKLEALTREETTSRLEEFEKTIPDPEVSQEV